MFAQMLLPTSTWDCRNSGLIWSLQDDAALLEELLDVGGQLPRIGIDDLVLLLDPDGQVR